MVASIKSMRSGDNEDEEDKDTILD